MNLHRIGILSGIVLICWLIFILYWVISAVGVKKTVAGKGSRSGWPLSRLALILILYSAYKLPALAPFWHFADGLPIFHNEAVRIAGVVLTACGIAFAIWARGHLGREWSGRATIKVGHELITSGPYRFVRHPIYTGILTALFGSGFVNGPILMVVFVVAVCIFIRRIHKEEGYMMELFPDQYPAYRASTKALIPGIW